MRQVMISQIENKHDTTYPPKRIRVQLPTWRRPTGIVINLLIWGGLYSGAQIVDVPSPSIGTQSKWVGNPDALVKADNPYLALAEANVKRATTKPSVFWLAWGFAAPESSRRGNTKLRKLAIAEIDKKCAQLKANPQNRWAVLPTLESIRLMKNEPSIAPKQITSWLEAVRPAVDFFHNQSRSSNEREELWTDAAPNIMHQTAAFLQLASILYDTNEYAETAAKLVRKSVTHQEPDGAFRYIRNTGPSQIYFGFDATFLGRYYQLSQDPIAKAALIKMAKYAKDILPNGLTEGTSAPWWKHHWSDGGPIHGVEIVAGLSKDPLARSVAEYRLAVGQRHYFSYYAMYFWLPNIPIVPLAPDLCCYNTNIGGPQLRRGPWQVVMPAKACADTGIGCAVATGDKPFHFDGFLEIAALPILKKGEINAYGKNSLLILADEDTTNRADMVGNGWIASARSFQPRSPYYGDATAPPPGGWRVVELWYADATSLVGWLTAFPKNSDHDEIAGTPHGYLALGYPLEATSPTQGKSGALFLKLHGEGVHWHTGDNLGSPSRKSMGPRADCAWISPSTSTPGYGLSVTSDKNKQLMLRVLKISPIIEVLAIGADGKKVKLLFNPDTKEHEIVLSSRDPVTVWLSASDGKITQRHVRTLILRSMQMGLMFNSTSND